MTNETIKEINGLAEKMARMILSDSREDKATVGEAYLTVFKNRLIYDVKKGLENS